MVNLTPAAVAGTVTDVMHDRDVSQVQLSELSHMPRSTLQRRLVDGDFTVSELTAVAIALDTTPDAILSEAGRRAAEVA